MAEILYFPDNEYRKQFEAVVEKSRNKSGEDSDGYLVLDRTLFYKEGGGQPADHGNIRWDDEELEVTDVQKKHGEIRHYVKGGELPEADDRIEGKIDWERRCKHMRMHTAQHVLSKVVLDNYDASTAGNQIHEDYSRIDFEPVEFDDQDIDKIENLANEMIARELDVTKKMMSRDRLEAEVEEGRTNLDLIPDSVDPLRAVIIGDEDICPCGGTHVDSIKEIGEIDIKERISKGADVERIEFELN